jgi:hypothetical protein
LEAAGVGAEKGTFHFIVTPFKEMKYLKPMQEVG